MAENGSLLLIHILTSCILALNVCLSGSAAADEDREVYIVYMGSLPEGGEYSPSSHHLSLLQDVVQDSSSQNFLLRSYARSFNGFAAKLTDHEAQKLATRKEVISIFRSRTLKLRTTRSWNFIGLNGTTTPGDRRRQSNIIVGHLDSGIWPESESFNDQGLGPVPMKWKGVCKGGQNFTCNNKIIGARYYGENGSARDDNGHGTHTASTAAGNLVNDASFYGFGQGIARGGVPLARIASYKVCKGESCESSWILAAFDDAIADGVDIITISLAPDRAVPLVKDPIAIGAFHAISKGILTIQSAGNEGPDEATVKSVAPWILSVAASTTDRRIIDKLILGNGNTTFVGNSISPFTLNGTKFPLIYGSAATNSCTLWAAGSCIKDCLDSRLVKGKILLCEAIDEPEEAKRADALGAIFQYDSDNSFLPPWPALTLHADDFKAVLNSYTNSTGTKKPSATILKSETIKDSSAPVVASFSSRGPNPMIPDILKPDISAPGMDILAAYVPVMPPMNPIFPDDKRRTNYTFLSGTSMSCPHAAGVAAYVKSSHPDWSPSAIQSAIMTSAWPMNASEKSMGEFAYGSGHINPVQAINPGLVYEAMRHDYIRLLCGIGYDEKAIRGIAGDNSSCRHKSTMPKDFNYPSMTVKVSPPGKSFTETFHRTVTNVGFANATYKAEVVSDSTLKIKVVPQLLSFNYLNEKKSFDVTVEGRLAPGAVASASLVWSDGSHKVRSPIVVYN